MNRTTDTYREATRPRLELRGIRKVYPTVVANDGVDLAVEPGEIHAVLGENGAGKSTLMKIIFGIVKPDAGDIIWDGQRVEIASPNIARQQGIAMVFQHFSLFETLTVAENVALAMPRDTNISVLSRKIVSLSERYGLPVDPRRLVHSLSIGERQRVEIIRCLLQNPQLLIMDEPTSVLTPQAVQKLFETLRRLADEGRSILYISHKLDEIKALCHTATVLSAGKVSGVCDPRTEPSSRLARLMIGKDLPACDHPEAKSGGDRKLVVGNLSWRSEDEFGTDLVDICLTVHSGEVVGIAGISGNGQQEFLESLSGEQLLSNKSAIRICGTDIGNLGPAARRRLGLCYVPEERLGRGAVPAMSLADNALLTARGLGMVNWGLVRLAKVNAFAELCIERFDVKCGGRNAEVTSLSGGNLQKFIVGREILQEPRVLIVAQPTWGLDVGAAAFIRQSLVDLRNSGAAVLVVSEELDELFEICDRIAVIANGRLSPCKRTEDTDVEEIGLWMTGMWPSETCDSSSPRETEAKNATRI